MFLQRLLQINMATLSALAVLLLGMGQRSMEMPLLAITAAMVSVWLTDITGWIRLGHKTASLAAAVAAAVSLRDFLYFDGELWLMSTASFLIYLQMIIFFQQKDDRTYWQLLLLSLAQVLVAAVFNQGVWFGVLLVVYLLTGLSALALFFLQRQALRYDFKQPPPAPTPTSQRRWSLSTVSPSFSSALAETPQAAIGLGLFARLGLMGLGSLALTLVLFFTVPRLGRTTWQGAVVAPERVVGFSDQVALGELGEIMENRDQVMRVWLSDATSEKPYVSPPELYLRGAELTYYRDGHWEDRLRMAEWSTPHQRGSLAAWLSTVRSALRSKPEDPPEIPPLILQRIVIEPLDRDELFYVTPIHIFAGKQNLRFGKGRILRPADTRFERFCYEFNTTAFCSGVQSALVPRHRLSRAQLEELTRTPALPVLTQLAQQWMSQSGLEPGDRMGRALYLEHCFRDSRHFQYSLKGQDRDWELDPIEDFVSNNPRGHCEYFATALALMLRTQGIPSRIVIGYKCNEFNELGGFYQVRQLHAHSWVEAYLEPWHLSPELTPENLDPTAQGAWLRLDPTPGAPGFESAGWVGGFLHNAERRFDWIEALWANYVMEMDRNRQRDAIYQPLLDAAKGIIASLRDPQWWRDFARSFCQILHLGSGDRIAGWLYVILAALVGAPLLALSRRPLGRVIGWLHARLMRRGVSPRHAGHTDVEFYGRMERLLARHGLVRAAGQTQREFAQTAGASIAAANGRAETAWLPLQVAEAFYRVRFGNLPLDNPRREAVEQALAQLSQEMEKT